ncbi:MAG: NADH-quinone oxidoreductase subunit J [Planctomycetes bacterium]|nr:NADH-quinone oxidoreductase subunit J [Planctomycetota bacterium]
MNFADILAYTLGAATLAAALGVVLRRDAVVAAMNLVLSFFCLSGIYLILGFPFLAAIQILVYAGAIMVLFLFVIMLLGVSTLARTPVGARSGLGAAIALAVVVEGAVLSVKLASGAAANTAATTETVAGVSELLFKQGLVLPFEITGVVLLAAMVAVVVIGRRDLRVRSVADFAREHAFDPRPLVTSMPPPAAPDGLDAHGLHTNGIIKNNARAAGEHHNSEEIAK